MHPIEALTWMLTIAAVAWHLQRGPSAEGVPGLLWMGAVAVLAALRTTAVEGEGFDRESRPEGRWSRPAGQVEGGLARIEGFEPRIAAEDGLVGEGELVRLVSVRHPVLRARAPEEDLDESESYSPALPPPVARLEVGPEDLLRLEAPRSTSAGAWLRGRVESTRGFVIARTHSLSDSELRGVLRALLVGDRSGLTNGLAELFTRTGTRHLLALSGLHVALVAWLLARPVARALGALCRVLLGAASPATGGAMGASGGVRAIEAALVLTLVPLAGGAAPVTRAATAGSLAILAAIVPDRRGALQGLRVGRRVDALSLWSLALTFELALRPEAVTSIAAGLSYAATLGLVLAYGGVRRRLAACLPCAGRIPATGATGLPRSAWWRAPLQRVLDASLACSAASIAALLATLPIVWSVFGETSWTSVPATTLSLPFVAWTIATGWMRVLVGSALPESVLAFPVQAWIATLEFWDAWPATPLPLPPRPGLLLVGVSVLGLLALAGRGGRWLSRACLLLAAVVILPWAPDAGRLEVHVLDVGHGTAALGGL
jgi:competence protein ComEC